MNIFPVIWPRSFTKRETYCKIIRGIFSYFVLVCFGPGYFGFSERLPKEEGEGDSDPADDTEGTSYYILYIYIYYALQVEGEAGRGLQRLEVRSFGWLLQDLRKPKVPRTKTYKDKL